MKNREKIINKLASLGYGDGMHSYKMGIFLGALKVIIPAVLIAMAIGAMVFILIFMIDK